jgi:Cupin
LELLASETAEPAPGSELMVYRLPDILFIQGVRAHIVSISETCKSGWLNAIFNPKIGAALKAARKSRESVDGGNGGSDRKHVSLGLCIEIQSTVKVLHAP